MLIDELAKEYVKNLKNEEKRKKQERRQTDVGKTGVDHSKKSTENGWEKTRKERLIQGVTYAVLQLVIGVSTYAEGIRVFIIKVGNPKELYAFIVFAILFLIINLSFFILSDITIKKAIKDAPLIGESDLEETRVLRELLISKKVDIASEKAINAIASEVEILRNKKTYELKGATVYLQMFSSLIFPLLLALFGGYLQNLKNDLKVELLDAVSKLCIGSSAVILLLVVVFSTSPFRLVNKLERLRQGLRKMQIVGDEERGKVIHNLGNTETSVENTVEKSCLNNSSKSVEYSIRTNDGKIRKNQR